MKQKHTTVSLRRILANVIASVGAFSMSQSHTVPAVRYRPQVTCHTRTGSTECVAGGRLGPAVEFPVKRVVIWRSLASVDGNDVLSSPDGVTSSVRCTLLNHIVTCEFTDVHVRQTTAHLRQKNIRAATYVPLETSTRVIKAEKHREVIRRYV